MENTVAVEEIADVLYGMIDRLKDLMVITEDALDDNPTSDQIMVLRDDLYNEGPALKEAIEIASVLAQQYWVKLHMGNYQGAFGY